MGKMVESNVYNGCMALLITINLAHSVAETDLRAAGDLGLMMPLLSKMFFVSYTLDLLSRLFVYRIKYWASLMNWFDAFIVSSDLILLTFESVIGDVPSLAILRGLRMLRIIRVIRNAVAFRELYLMMMGIISAVRAIAFGTVLIVIVLILWSMLAVELLQADNLRLSREGLHGDCARCSKAFATVGDAMLTLTQSIIAGDSWGLIAIPLLETSATAHFIIFGAFISLNLGLMNVVAAVIVDRQAQARLDDEKLHSSCEEKNWRDRTPNSSTSLPQWMMTIPAA